MALTDAADLLTQIGRNIRAERARRGLAQEALAHQAGMAVTHLARIERGETDAGISKIVLLARVLEVKAAILLQDVE